MVAILSRPQCVKYISTWPNLVVTVSASKSLRLWDVFFCRQTFFKFVGEIPRNYTAFRASGIVNRIVWQRHNVMKTFDTLERSGIMLELVIYSRGEWMTKLAWHSSTLEWDPMNELRAVVIILYYTKRKRTSLLNLEMKIKSSMIWHTL